MANPYYQTPYYGNNYQSGPIFSPLLTPSWNENPYFTNSGNSNAYPQAYQGASPYGPNPNPGFFRSLNQLTNPFNRDPMFGDPISNNQAAVNNVVSKPVDATVWAGQRIAVPIAISAMSYNMLGMKANPAGGMATAGDWLMGRNLGAAGNFSQSVFGQGSAGMMRGMGLNAGFSEGAGSVIGGLAGRVGALAGPQLVAQAAITGIDQTLFQPYINTRRSAMDLQQNFAGITFGDARGNAISGQGLSGREAYNMAGQISHQGATDMSFSRSQYTQVADSIERSGLLDTANSSQITSRIGSIASQIKLVMAISKDPNFQNAIEEISKLQMAGTSTVGGRFSQSAQVYTQLGRTAMQAGTTVQRLMETVGSAGQSMYQQQGMTPYMGQLAISNIYASMAAGQRTGVLSQAQIARMGGIENGAYSALSAEVQGGRTTIAQMALYNQYFGGKGGSAVGGRNMSLPSTISAYGSSFGADQMGTMGRMALFGDQMNANDIAKNGGTSLENMAASIASITPGMKKNANGQYDAEQMAVILQSMGETRDQITSFYAQRMADQDPAVAAQKGRASDAFASQQIRQYMSQNSTYSGAVGSAYGRVRRGANSALASIGDDVSDITAKVVGGGQDTVAGVWDSLSYGGIGAGQRVDDASKMFASNNQMSAKVGFLNTDATFDSSENWKAFTSLNPLAGFQTDDNKFNNRDAKKLNSGINALAKAGDSDAIAFLSSTGNAKSSALSRVLAKNKEALGSAGDKLSITGDSHAFQKYLDFATANQASPDTNVVSKSTLEEYQSNLDNIVGKGGSMFGDLQSIGEAVNLANKSMGPNGHLDAGNVDDFLKDPANASLAKMVGGATRDDALDKIKSIITNSGQAGMAGIGVQAAGMDIDKIKKDPSLINNPTIRAQFVASMKANDDKGMDQALVENLTDSLGGRTSGTKLARLGNIPLQDQLGEINTDADNMSTQRDLQSKLKKGLLDFSGYQNSMNALDMGKAVDKFSDAVDNFVKGTGGSGSSSSSSGSSSPSFWHKFSNAFSSDDTQRTR